MKFAELIEKWKRYCRKGEDPAWKKDVDSMIRNHILPILGELELEQIDQFKISDVLNAVKEKGLSSQTERHIYNILNQAFRAAVVRFKVIAESPVVREHHISKVVNKTPVFLNYETAWLVLDYLYHDDKFGMIVWLQITAGLRVGEAIGVRWSDVDFVNNKIHVRNVWNKKLKVMKPHRKNKGQFTVPMIPALRKRLLAVQDKTGYVARDERGKHVSYEGYKTFLRRLRVKLKLELKGSHGLRHTTNEIWQLGLDQLQVLLGHDSRRSTERYYHRKEVELQKLARQVKRKARAA